MAELLYREESFQIRKYIYDIYKRYRNYHKEVVYHNSLMKELLDAGFEVIKNKRLPIYHKGEKVGTYVPDMIINNKIIIELKCKPKLLMDDRRQFWHYLKSTDYKLGFLVNFGRSGGVEIQRMVFDEARSRKWRDSA